MKKTIAEWRSERNMTQGELSRKSGVMQATISRLECNETESAVKPGTIRKIAVALGVKYEQIDLGEFRIYAPKPRTNGTVELPPKFGAQLRVSRQSRGLSIEDLALKLDMSTKTIQTIENGERTRTKQKTLEVLQDFILNNPADLPEGETEPAAVTPLSPEPAVQSSSPPMGASQVAKTTPGIIKVNVMLTGTPAEVAAQIARLENGGTPNENL